MCPYLEKGVFTYVIKLRILQYSYLVFRMGLIFWGSFPCKIQNKERRPQEDKTQSPEGLESLQPE